MHPYLTGSFAFIFFISTALLTSLVCSLRRLHKRAAIKQLHELGNLFFYQKIQNNIFHKKEFEILYFSAATAQNIFRFFLATCVVLLLIQTNYFPFTVSGDDNLLDFNTANGYLSITATMITFALTMFVGDFFPRLLGNRFPVSSLNFSAPFVSIILTFFLPISYLILKLSKQVSRLIHTENLDAPVERIREKIYEILDEEETHSMMDPDEKKLIESVITFKDRIVREIMVPRVDVFSLDVKTTIREAARKLEEEGFSRVPVYRNNVDNVIGILMYKDILSVFMDVESGKLGEEILDSPLQNIVKNVLYTPETKKISALLQDIRKKQMHLAVVVDEYGGTEGIVTIEDILEEIVGEIADEYDEEEILYQALPDGSWIIDARMTIPDIEEQIGIKIPQEGEYDSIGGFIFHVTGAIPSRGFMIHQDEFELKVISSSERAVKRVRMIPRVLQEETEARAEGKKKPSEQTVSESDTSSAA